MQGSAGPSSNRVWRHQRAALGPTTRLLADSVARKPHKGRRGGQGAVKAGCLPGTGGDIHIQNAPWPFEPW